MKRSLSNDHLEFKAIKCIISDENISTLNKFQQIESIAKRNIDYCNKIEKEEEFWEREKVNDSVMNTWFNNAMKLIKKKISQKEFFKEESAVDNIKKFEDDLEFALEQTEKDIDFWYCEDIDLNFGDGIPCDKDDCWYANHLGRVNEFEGTMYYLRFINEKFQLCDLCYENCAEEIKYDKIRVDDFVDRFYQYLKNEWKE